MEVIENDSINFTFNVDNIAIVVYKNVTDKYC